MPASDNSSSTYNAFGPVLRFWRNALKLSQAELAAQLGTASRHISFLETGRSQPTQEMIDRLAEVFGFDNHERDLLRVSAGFMPTSEGIDENTPEKRYLLESATLLLNKHQPYPAVVVNNIGDIVLCNKSWINLLHYFRSDYRMPDQCNMFDQFFADHGLKDIIDNWELFSCIVLMKIQEQQLLTGNQRLKELCEWLQAYPGIPEDWIDQARQIGPRSFYPMEISIPDKDGETINFSSRGVITGIDPERLSPMSQLYMHAFFPITDAGKRFSEKLDKHPPEPHPLLCKEL